MKINMYLILLVVFITGFSNADIISVNFDNATTLPGTMETTDLAGADGVRVGNWNNWIKEDATLGDAGQTVIDDSGATVAGFTTTISGGTLARWASRDNLHTNDQEMYSDVFDVWGSTYTISVSNIPYDVYDVYVYMRDDGAGRAGEFTIGATTYYVRGGVGNPGSDGTGYVLSVDTTQGISSDIDQGNYIYFSNISGASFDLVMNAVNAGDLDRNKPAGFQIVAVCPVLPVADLTGDCIVNIDDLLVMIDQWLMDTDPAN